MFDCWEVVEFGLLLIGLEGVMNVWVCDGDDLIYVDFVSGWGVNMCLIGVVVYDWIGGVLKLIVDV